MYIKLNHHGFAMFNVKYEKGVSKLVEYALIFQPRKRNTYILGNLVDSLVTMFFFFKISIK